LISRFVRLDLEPQEFGVQSQFLGNLSPPQPCPFHGCHIFALNSGYAGKILFHLTLGRREPLTSMVDSFFAPLLRCVFQGRIGILNLSQSGCQFGNRRHPGTPLGPDHTNSQKQHGHCD
jgi:hypothetical protein